MNGKKNAIDFVDGLLDEYVENLRGVDPATITDDELRHVGSLVTLLNRMEGIEPPPAPLGIVRKR